MSTSPSQSIQSNASTSNSLLPPSVSGPHRQQQRRMTTSSLPPPAPLNLPEPINNDRRDTRRPPSPLRNAFTLDTLDDDLSEDGSQHRNDEDDEDDRRSWGARSHSPTPSMAKFASSFAHRVGSLVSNISPRNAGMPTDEEIEAEAEREREHSRREAERILLREAQDRKLVEDRVLALLDSSRDSGAPLQPPPPPARAPNPPSPSSSQKERSGWFSAVKSKLTPTKEPLTPAQQIIQDTKAREKDKKKGGGGSSGAEWPTSDSGKLTGPAFLSLSTAAVTPQRYSSSSASPTSPTPASRPLADGQPSLSPSPMRSTGSPSREPPPFYAQFDSHGTLDVASTLLVVARRFEKLERWTVGHVRALEERMSDVERWLVDKEKEKEAGGDEGGAKSMSESDLGDIREEMAELQGRVTEIGREMAKYAASSSGPSRSATAPVKTPSPVPASTAARRTLPTAPIPTTRPVSTPVAQSRTHESTSPPLSSFITTASARTRLPYPTGDYASPPGSSLAGALSPANSPPSSLTDASRRRPISIAGLPSSSTLTTPTPTSTTLGLPRPTSPIARTTSPATSTTLTSPNTSIPHPASTSPTPRKRYTVALGGPLVPPSDDDDSLFSRSSQYAAYLATPDPDDDAAAAAGSGRGREYGHVREDTVGKSASRMAGVQQQQQQQQQPPPASAPAHRTTLATPMATPTPRQGANASPRTRAQSSYGPPAGYSLLSPSPSPVTPLRPRVRSRSTDRFGLGLSDAKFVDPLLVRKQEKEGGALRTPKVANGRGKVPIGELVAFFDGDNK